MRVRDLITQLEALDADADVQVNEGEEVIDIRIVCDTRRRVQLITVIDDDATEATDEY